MSVDRVEDEHRRDDILVVKELVKQRHCHGLLRVVENPANASDPGVRWLAIRGLGRHGKAEMGGRLLPSLEDPSSDIRAVTAEALGRLRYREAVPGLIRKLSDSSRTVRRLSIIALGLIGDPRATEALREVAFHERAVERVHAVDSLGFIGGPEAIAALEPFLCDRAAWVRRRSRRALRQSQSA